MRASRSQAAQHITLEKVCTRERVRSSQMPASGLSCSFSACSPSAFESLEELRAARVRRVRSSKNRLGRREHDAAIDVVLDG